MQHASILYMYIHACICLPVDTTPKYCVIYAHTHMHVHAYQLTPHEIIASAPTCIYIYIYTYATCKYIIHIYTCMYMLTS